MAKKKPVEIDFVNDLKQTIKPGDEILIITTGYAHSVSVAPGRYLGMTEKDGSVIVIVQETRQVLRHKENNEIFDFAKHGPKGHYPEYPKLHYYQAPRWGMPPAKLTPEQEQENKEKMERYNVDREVYHEADRKAREPFHYVEELFERRSTLQRNRIYPINMPLKDFIRKI